MSDLAMLSMTDHNGRLPNIRINTDAVQAALGLLAGVG